MEEKTGRRFKVSEATGQRIDQLARVTGLTPGEVVDLMAENFASQAMAAIETAILENAKRQVAALKQEFKSH